MEITKNNISDSQMELSVLADPTEIEKYLDAAAANLSKEVKVAGFRPGKATYAVLKSQFGEMVIWEEAVKIFISKRLDDIVADNCPRPSLGMPDVSVVKLAPHNALEFKVGVVMLPTVTLGDYKNFDLRLEAVEATDDEVEKTIAELRESRATEALVDRPAIIGDKVLVDIKMFLDKVPIEGGQAKDTVVIIGKDYFVKGFDEKIIGAVKGEEREFVLRYPEDHFQKNIAGKKVEFVVIIKDVYERVMPPLDDVLAKNFGLDNLDELRQNIRQSLLSQKQRQASDKARARLLEKLLEVGQFGDLPAKLIDAELDMMMAEMEHNISGYGGKFDDYLLSIKKSKEDLRLDWHEDAVKRVKIALALRVVAEQEKLQVTEADIDHEIGHLREHYKQNEKAQEVLGSPAYRRRLASEMISHLTVDKLSEWNIKGYQPHQHRH